LRPARIAFDHAGNVGARVHQGRQQGEQRQHRCRMEDALTHRKATRTPSWRRTPGQFPEHADEADDARCHGATPSLALAGRQSVSHPGASRSGPTFAECYGNTTGSASDFPTVVIGYLVITFLLVRRRVRASCRYPTDASAQSLYEKPELPVRDVIPFP